MRYLPVVLMLGVIGSGLSGCSTMQKVQDKLPSFGSSTYKDPKVHGKPVLPVVDTSVPEKFIERLKPHDFNLGTWIRRTDNPEFIRADGPQFEPLPKVDDKSALVYLYRPDSNWNFQEIIAPSFFLNGMRLPSLVNNHYTWLELPPDTYRFAVRRPIGFIYFQKGTVIDFKVEAGKTYYLRYDEQGFRIKPDPSLGLLQKGPLTQMPEKLALAEMRYTTLNTPGYSFVQTVDEARDIKLPSFNGKPKKPVAASRITEKEKVIIGVPVKLYNPLTL